MGPGTGRSDVCVAVGSTVLGLLFLNLDVKILDHTAKVGCLLLQSFHTLSL
jgi:hypothetical protein